MGNEKQFLVVMENNDGYHVSERTVNYLVSAIESDTRVFDIFDVKMGARVYITPGKVSSIVELKGRSNGS